MLSELGEIPSTVPLSILRSFLYCERRAYLEWVDAYDVKTSDDEHGKDSLFLHQQLIKRWEMEFGEKIEESYFVSEDFKMEGKVEYVEDTLEKPVLSRSTPVLLRNTYPPPDVAAWPNDLVLATAIAALFESLATDSNSAWIFYGQGNQNSSRHLVEITTELRTQLAAQITTLFEMVRSGTLPKIIDDLDRCSRCPFAALCHPDEVGPQEGKPIWVSDDVKRPMYVTGADLSINKVGGRFEVRRREEVIDDVKAIELSQLNLYGGVRISTQTVSELLKRDVPILYFSAGGWFNGITTSSLSGRIDLRIRQFHRFQYGDLELAKSVVSAKVRNYRTLLKRNSVTVGSSVLKRLKEIYSRTIFDCSEFQTLLGLEGIAAKIYFENFASMIKYRDDGYSSTFDFQGRNRRPPLDPINSMLSYAYAVLIKDIFVELLGVGFDPFLGFYHKPRFGRPALALDLAEEFRPLVADSIVLTLINKRMVDDEDFLIHPRGVTLTSSGKKKLLMAYQSRLNSEVIHKELGYRITYKRALEAQARILAAVLVGDRDGYTPFITR